MSFVQQAAWRSLRPRPAATLPRRINPVSSRRNFSLLGAFDQVSTLTAEGITFVHHAGLPWYVTIPLVAAGVNFTVRLPMQYYSRRLLAKRLALRPFVDAWAFRHQQSNTRDPSKALELNRAKLRKSQSRIYKEWGVQMWKSWTGPVVATVPFILFSDALRRLAGVRTFTTTSADQAVDSGVQALQAVPSMVDGGLLWFTDLTVADPYYILPVVCTGLLGLNAWKGMTKEKLLELLGVGSSSTGTTAWQRGLMRTMMIFPFFPLIMSHLPSAIFLYWATSFSLTRVNFFILERRVKMPTPDLTMPKPKKRFDPFLRTYGYNERYSKKMDPGPKTTQST